MKKNTANPTSSWEKKRRWQTYTITGTLVDALITGKLRDFKRDGNENFMDPEQMADQLDDHLSATIARYPFTETREEFYKQLDFLRDRLWKQYKLPLPPTLLKWLPQNNVIQYKQFDLVRLSKLSSSELREVRPRPTIWPPLSKLQVIELGHQFEKPKHAFYKLNNYMPVYSLPPTYSVHHVYDTDSLQEARHQIENWLEKARADRKSPWMGADCEWSMYSTFADEDRLSTVQFSTLEFGWLFYCEPLVHNCPEYTAKFFYDLFKNPYINFLGFQFNSRGGDHTRISYKFECFLNDAKTNSNALNNTSKRYFPLPRRMIDLKNSGTGASLTALTYLVLGKPLSKLQTYTHWTRADNYPETQLRGAQEDYAMKDAQVLVAIAMKQNQKMNDNDKPFFASTGKVFPSASELTSSSAPQRTHFSSIAKANKKSRENFTDYMDDHPQRTSTKPILRLASTTNAQDPNRNIRKNALSSVSEVPNVSSPTVGPLGEHESTFYPLTNSDIENYLAKHLQSSKEQQKHKGMEHKKCEENLRKRHCMEEEKKNQEENERKKRKMNERRKQLAQILPGTPDLSARLISTGIQLLWKRPRDNGLPIHNYAVFLWAKQATLDASSSPARPDGFWACLGTTPNTHFFIESKYMNRPNTSQHKRGPMPPKTAPKFTKRMLPDRSFPWTPQETRHIVFGVKAQNRNGQCEIKTNGTVELAFTSTGSGQRSTNCSRRSLQSTQKHRREYYAKHGYDPPQRRELPRVRAETKNFEEPDNEANLEQMPKEHTFAGEKRCTYKGAHEPLPNHFQKTAHEKLEYMTPCSVQPGLCHCSCRHITVHDCPLPEEHKVCGDNNDCHCRCGDCQY